VQSKVEATSLRNMGATQLRQTDRFARLRVPNLHLGHGDSSGCFQISETFEELLTVQGHTDFEGFNRKPVALVELAHEFLRRVHSWLQVDQHAWFREERVPFEDTCREIISND